MQQFVKDKLSLNHIVIGLPFTIRVVKCFSDIFVIRVGWEGPQRGKEGPTMG